jgi:hypothetical protein
LAFDLLWAKSAQAERHPGRRCLSSLPPGPGPGPAAAPRARSVLRQYRERVEAEGEFDEEELPADVMDGLEDAAKAQFAVRAPARRGRRPKERRKGKARSRPPPEAMAPQLPPSARAGRRNARAGAAWRRAPVSGRRAPERRPPLRPADVPGALCARARAVPALLLPARRVAAVAQPRAPAQARRRTAVPWLRQGAPV